jgi:hypothetical protein
MVDRLRDFLNRPLDPASSRAILVLAAAIFLGFAAVVVLATDGEHGHREGRSGSAEREARVSAPISARLEQNHPLRPPARPRQDPQDDRASAPGRRAQSALRTHRALQHLPYRDGAVSVVLAGDRRGRAVLLVRAATLEAARRGWQGFLRRYRDSGSVYVPDFAVAEVRHG